MLYRTFILFLAFVGILGSVIACRERPDQAGEAIPLPTPAETGDTWAVLRFSAEALVPPATGEQFIVTANSVRPLSGQSAEIETPAVIAPLPFNYVVPEWHALLPAGSQLTVRARTADLEGPWSGWQEVEINGDALTEDPTFFPGALIGVPDVTTTQQRVQFSVTFTPSSSGQMPVLNDLALIFIDATGPTTREILRENLNPRQKVAAQETAAQALYPKPPVVRRTQWCVHTACNYTEGLAYHPVTHLVVHHTVSNNATTDWAANVRAIWNYHTFSRQWGDIGYNYLVDPNGVIYEGHLGGDDVVGTHAAGANRGSLGVAMLGTFGTTPPPEAMLNAIAELLAWKVSQRNIALWDASVLPDMNWGLLHLVGHRDVYGTTTCPGTTGHTYLPEIRRRVAARLGISPNAIILDERESGFVKSNANWYSGPYACGYNQHAWYTFSTTSPSQATNWGEWRPNLPAAGLYRVEAFVPYCNMSAGTTRQAPYSITHSQGTTRLVQDQHAQRGLWVSLGEYNFAAGRSAVIRLGDLTTGENDRPILYDAMRFIRLDLTATNLTPTADQWLTDRAVTFTWSITGASGAGAVRVQVSARSDFATLLLDQPVSPAVTAVSHTFDQDYAALYWRVHVTRAVGGEFTSAPTRFQIDATPPVSRIHTLHRECNGNFTLFWEGSDNLSGIAGYTIEMQAPGGTAPWLPLVANTTVTEYTFAPDNPVLNYRFRSQAVDGRGNVEPPKPEGDLSVSDGIPCDIVPPANVSPVADGWQISRAVNFEWAIALPQAVRDWLLEVAADSDFGTIVATRELPGNVTRALLTFEEDYEALYWRVTATTVLDRDFRSTPTRFGLDTTPPVSRIDDVWQESNGDLTFFWSGEDTLSGVAAWTVEAQPVTGGGWQVISADTTQTSTRWAPPDPTVAYRVRSVARDRAGNVELPKPQGDMGSADGCLWGAEPALHLAPQDGAWRSGQRVMLRWNIGRSRCLTESRLDVATDPDMANIVFSTPLSGDTDRFQFDFDQPRESITWRVTQRTVTGEIRLSTPTQVRFDRIAPTSAVVAIAQTVDGGYRLFADGSDEGAGIAAWIFEYRRDDSEIWYRIGTTRDPEISVNFLEPGVRYWFRSLALDAAGNMQPATSAGDLSTDEATPLQRFWLPIVFRE
jgi:hypothetical protein